MEQLKNSGMRLQNMIFDSSCMFCTDIAVVCLIIFVLGLDLRVVLGEPSSSFCPCPSLPEVASIGPEKCKADDFGSPGHLVLHPLMISELDDLDPLTKKFIVFRRHIRKEGGQSIEHSPYPWEMSPKNLLQREPYLVFTVHFLILRMQSLGIVGLRFS
jgi:hypothetical protein